MSRMFYRGVPYEPDVRKLRESYPESQLQQGQVIPYPEIEHLLHERKDSNRWLGVITQWRKVVEEEVGFVIGVERGVGFKVLDEAGKLEKAGSNLRGAVKKSKRSLEIASLINSEKLPEGGKKRLIFIETQNSKVIAALQIKSPKKLMPEMGVN